MAEQFEIPPVRTRDILLGTGPRFARDAFGPMLAFYVGWKLAGLVVGIAVSTALALAILWHERRQDRHGLMVKIGLGIVVVQAVIGLVADSERVYLAQPVLVSGLYGLAFCVSVLIRRPLAGSFADAFYPFPPEVRSSETFRGAFSRVSLVWGVYLLFRSVTRLAVLADGSVEGFLVTNLLTGVPLTAVLMGWSVWYSTRYFRRSEEWGPALRALEAAGWSVDALPPLDPTEEAGPMGEKPVTEEAGP